LLNAPARCCAWIDPQALVNVPPMPANARSDSRLRLAEQVRDLVQVVLNERRQSGGITGQWAAMFGISYAT
jgi:hypothetical protein